MLETNNITVIEETNTELEKLKGKWEIEKKVSGSFDVPENILDLEGVEYLLKLNIFNEVPTVLSIVAPSLAEYEVLSEASEYSEEKYKEYVEKGCRIIENLLGMYKSFKIDLGTAEEYIFQASKGYITYLAANIGKSETYNFN